MTKNKNKFTLLPILGIVLVLGAVGALFFQAAQDASSSRVPETDPANFTATPTGVWEALLQATPYAYFTPLPEPVVSALDGTYAKVDQSWPQWWRCLRCADYRAAGGIWKLQFDQGVLRIHYDVNDWRSIASYIVQDDRLFIFNDPYCPEHTGEYKWRIEAGGLRLEKINDPCAFDLRAQNLTAQDWLSCSDSATASSSTGGLPPGCEANPRPGLAATTPEPPLQVTVHGGDSRFFASPPDVIVHANADDMPPPEGISVSFSQDSIPYGLQRVLWWNGGWIEATSENAYASMGVQFLGEGMIGWARVLFDGQEVWRGKTSEIWSKSGRHGGFVEVTGFAPGVHTLRVEVLGFDYRPVTVSNFGFSTNGGVSNERP